MQLPLSLYSLSDVAEEHHSLDEINLMTHMEKLDCSRSNVI